MLQDPENLKLWTQSIRAKDQAEAEVECQRIADREVLTTLVNITQETKTPDRNGKVKFTCWFQTEGATDDDSDDSN